MVRAAILAALWHCFVRVPAQAQWAATVLHNSADYRSAVIGVTAAHEIGSWQATAFSLSKPVIWSGTTSFVSLAPGLNDWGYAGANSDDAQYGSFRGRAAVWHGTAASRIDLDLAGEVVSEALSQFQGQQVGYRGDRATLWQGTAASAVDLHPGGVRDTSIAYGTDGIHQGGYFQTEFGTPHAVLWSGTASSMADLNPTSAASSRIYGMVPGQQAGYATLGTPQVLHGGIWSGTAASFIDLNPPNSTSQLYATCGTAQVGILNGGDAAIWFGTATSVVNLADYLPSAYFYSVATSVYEKNGTFYVGGWGQRSSGTPQEAPLWVGTPACYANCDGGTSAPALNVLDFTCFLQRFAAADLYANCDRSTTAPTLNVLDFTCFLQKFAAGCP